MKTGNALIGSIIFFLFAPCVVAGVMPWLLTGWEARLQPGAVVKSAAYLLVGAGVIFLLQAFGRFVFEGHGTPAPVAPTDRLVVGGVFRYIRNPMYVSVLSIILGQALLFGSGGVVVYAALAGTVMFAFVKLYEEPLLAQRYGAQYAAYRKAVPGWWPRFTPWYEDQ